jgi:hypothetical protein
VTLSEVKVQLRLMMTPVEGWGNVC